MLCLCLQVIQIGGNGQLVLPSGQQILQTAGLGQSFQVQGQNGQIQQVQLLQPQATQNAAGQQPQQVGVQPNLCLLKRMCLN